MTLTVDEILSTAHP